MLTLFCDDCFERLTEILLVIAGLGLLVALADQVLQLVHSQRIRAACERQLARAGAEAPPPPEPPGP